MAKHTKINLDLTVSPVKLEKHESVLKKEESIGTSPDQYKQIILTLLDKLEKIPEITAILRQTLDVMADINPNIHPIKWHVLNDWRIKIADCIGQLSDLSVETTFPSVKDQVLEGNSDGDNNS